MASIACRIATMVHHKDRKGRGAGMTQVAVRISPGRKWNMNSIRIVYCTFRGRAVMTVAANTRDGTVVVTSPQPGNCIQVAGIAIGTDWRSSMSRTLALSCRTIVATRACAGSVVFECRWNPGYEIMAIVTVIGCHPGSGMGA